LSEKEEFKESELLFGLISFY